MKYALMIIALAIAALFISTACPTVYLGDSGETASTAYTLGIGHPPGYPLQTLLGKISTLMPLADIAFRVNLLSIFSGVAVFLMFFLCCSFTLTEFFRVDKRQAGITSILTGLVLVFSVLFWGQALHAKGGIYLITFLCVLIAYYFTASFTKSGKNPHLYMAAYMIGFLPCLHNITLLFVIFAAGILFFTSVRLKKIKQLTYAVLFFLFSFTTSFLYLFIRAKAKPVICWDEIYTTAEVVNHILRTVYSNNPQAFFSYAAFFSKIIGYFLQYLKCYNIFILFFLYGLYTAYKTQRKTFYIFISYIVLNNFLLVTLTSYSFSPIFTHINETFNLVTDIFTLFIAAAGLNSLLSAAKSKFGINLLFVSSIIFLVPIMMLFSNFEKNNASKKFLSYDIAYNIMSLLHPGDILFTDLDCPTFDLLYARYVRKQALDIQVYDRDGSFFDRSLYKVIRYKFTRKDADELEADICMKNPGKVFYTDMLEYTGKDLITRPYGMDFIMLSRSAKLVNAEKLMQISSFRDFFNNKENDIYYREELSKHLIQYARFAIEKNDFVSFKKYCDAAEDLSPDNPTILKIIAYLYYYDAKNIQASLDYLLKDVNIDPYDLIAIGILIDMYTSFNPQQAVYWLKVYIKRQDNPQKKQAAYEDLKSIVQALQAQQKH